jgi:hypothetical protein
MEQLAIHPGPHFIDRCQLKRHENRRWDVLAGVGLREQGLERIIAASHYLADGICPPARMLGSRQYSCQHPFPIWRAWVETTFRIAQK